MRLALRFHGPMAAGVLDVLAGLWLFLSPFVLAHYAASAMSDDILMGTLISLVGAISVLSTKNVIWPQWLNELLGLWVFVSPWILHFARSHDAVNNNVVVGLLVFGIAARTVIFS